MKVKSPVELIRKLRWEIYVMIALTSFFGLIFMSGRGVHNTLYTLPNGDTVYMNVAQNVPAAYTVKGSGLSVILQPVVHNSLSAWMYFFAVTTLIGLIGMVISRRQIQQSVAPKSTAIVKDDSK